MHIQDDFCRDTVFLKRLEELSLWKGMVGKYHWWDGWWSRPPQSIWEELVMNIWQGRVAENSIAGFEFWCNVLGGNGPKKNLGWHKDKDERLIQQEGTMSCPMIGTVYYAYPHKISGGFLEIATDDSLDEVERIAPKHNRLVIFDASQFHRVTRIYAGTRVGFQVNLWSSKPLTFSDTDITSSTY